VLQLDARQQLTLYGLAPLRCFAPAGSVQTDGQCNVINFIEGSKKPFPIKGVDLCSSVPDIEPCIFQDMVNLAKKAGSDIGAYIRVDMFVGADGKVYVQEFSTNHLNGNRHCSAKVLPNGCIDSCFLGAMWNDLGSSSNLLFGGRKPDTPAALSAFLALPDEAGKCKAAVDLEAAPFPPTSTCGVSGGTSDPMGPPDFTAPPAGGSTTVPAVAPSRSASPSAIDTPVVGGECPVDGPDGGTDCFLSDSISCPYGELCCHTNLCLNTTIAMCESGKWAVVAVDPFCDAPCPSTKPAPNSACTISEQLSCDYDFVTCPDGSSGNTTFCMCNGGQFICASASACTIPDTGGAPPALPTSVANGIPSTSPSSAPSGSPSGSPSVAAVCPVAQPTDVNSCDLPVSLVCRYNLITCVDTSEKFTVQCICTDNVNTCESIQACRQLNVDIPIGDVSMTPSAVPFTAVNIPKPDVPA
jgi:hypothetical protein